MFHAFDLEAVVRIGDGSVAAAVVDTAAGGGSLALRSGRVLGETFTLAPLCPAVLEPYLEEEKGKHLNPKLSM